MNEIYEQYINKLDKNYNIEDLKFELFLVKEALEKNLSNKGKEMLNKCFDIQTQIRIAEGKEIISYILSKIKTP